MMGLDRDKHPVRFAIFTSVASGLAVMTIAAVGSQFAIRLLAYRVPVWLLILPLLAVAGFFALGGALPRGRKTEVFSPYAR